MNWETILKKRRFQSMYFKEVREALLKIVKNIESGDRFKMVDLKDELVEALRKERTDANKDYNRALTQFSNYKAENWLKMTGAKIINNQRLTEDVHSSTGHFKVKI